MVDLIDLWLICAQQLMACADVAGLYTDKVDTNLSACVFSLSAGWPSPLLTDLQNVFSLNFGDVQYQTLIRGSR